MASNRRNPKKDDLTPEGRVLQQVRTLQRLAANYREDFYGPNHFDDIEKFYTLDSPIGRVPTFRPAVQVPHLQLMGITEASDLADMNPRIIIIREGARQRSREAGLMAQWRGNYVNNQILQAAVWSFLNGNGYLQVGFDRYARRGKGAVWVKSRRPNSVFIDPAADSEDDWHFILLRDRFYPEQIAELFPQTGQDLRVAEPSGAGEVLPGDFNLSLPRNSPISIPGGLPDERVAPSDGRIDVDSLYIFDPSIEDVVKEAAGSEAAKAVAQGSMARFKLKYPNGRLLVIGNNRILFDGDNPNPRRAFPLVRLLGMPALTGFYAPPPIRYTKSLQTLAERMLTQTFENACRLNNGVWFLPENCGISPEDFGGIPGEVRVVSGQGGTPKMEMVKPFPQHMVQYPQTLLALQEKLQGFTSARQGNPGGGNIGTELYDAAVLQAQSMTRMRAKFMAESVQRIATQMFYLMGAYYRDDNFPDFSSGSGEGSQDGFKMAEWSHIGLSGLEDFEVTLDPASITPLSQLALQKMVPVLRKEGMLDTKTALEMLNVPAATEVAEGLKEEQQLAALAKVKKK